MPLSATASILPPPDEEQRAHSARVLRAVREAIVARAGWMSLEQYVQLVLYAPGLGYYSAGSAKLGREGDFVTAPELSVLFGRALARQCAQVLRDTGGDIVELGAGSGRLAAVLLPALAQLSALPEHYDILEVSADLIERQRRQLAALEPSLAARVRWLGQLPRARRGVFLANEVVDALPFQRFVVGAETDGELGVALSSQGELALAERPADAALAARLARLRATLPPEQGPWPPGYVSEVCALVGPWMSALGTALDQGMLLILDYGLPRAEYYHPQRLHGTLRCHYRHRAHDDVLLYPGLQDISAWVDFTQLAESAADAGLMVSGYCTQAAFLLANEIEAEVAAASSDLERARLASEARQLLLPGEMGESFKAMALTRGWDEPLQGFSVQDLRRTL